MAGALKLTRNQLASFLKDPEQIKQFEKLVNGEKVEGQKKACNFDTLYYCWKWGLKEDITWI
jgi:hypothetical protein